MNLHAISDVIAVLVAVVGLALLAMLAGLIRRAYSHNSLAQHRTKEAGFADLLLYANIVHPGVIVGKDGSFMASWRFAGDDDASSTVEHRESVTRQINAAFAQMGAGWMLHIDACRSPTPSYSARELSHFPDPISRAIDEERRRMFSDRGAQFKTEFTITLTWHPPLVAERRFMELMFDDDQAPVDADGRMSQLLDTFNRECASFESRLSSVFLMTRLKDRIEVQEDGRECAYDEFLSLLEYCISGERRPVAMPKDPMFIDLLVGGREAWTGVVPKIGRNYLQVVAIDGFPNESHPGILSALAELPITYRWSTRFIFLDDHQAVSEIEKFRRKWKQKVRGFRDQLFNNVNGRIDEHAQSMVREADNALAEVNSRFVKAGYYTSAIILMTEDRDALADAALYIEKKISGLGFGARIETINTFDAFMGSLPGHGVENVRRPLLHSGNLADLMPTSSIWTGEEQAPCPMYPPLAPALLHCATDGYTPFWLNLHVGDLGHAIMLGQTRAGKSTFLALLAAQFRRYEGARVIAFDKGNSLYPTCSAVGGQHYTISVGAHRQLSFCPLKFIDTPADRAWAMEWIDQILGLNGVITGPKQRNKIATAISEMHQTKQYTLSDFVIIVQDEEIRAGLKQYTVGGFLGELLDAKEDGLEVMDFVVFELEELFKMDRKYALPVLLYLFRRIEMSLDGRPTLMPLDEAWIMLDHDVFRPKIRDWLKSYAKKNVAVFMATQSLSDIKNSGILDVISESTATKIFLPNVYARNEETAELYIKMGLNRRQIDMIASAKRKRDYYYVSERGRRMFQLHLGPLALAFVGATDLDSIAAIKELEAKHGRGWPEVWLKERGVNAHFSR